MKLFVCNINFKTTSEGLKEIFQPYGEVISANIAKDKETQRSKGYGFVEMSESDCNEAIKGLNDVEIEGRKLGVREATERARA